LLIYLDKFDHVTKTSKDETCRIGPISSPLSIVNNCPWLRLKQLSTLRLDNRADMKTAVF